VGTEEYDRKTFVADSAKAFAERRITKREFLRRLGIAGLGLSGFAAAMLGRTRPFPGLTPPAAMADTGASPEMTKWLQDVGSKLQGHEDPLHLRGDAAHHRRQPTRQGRVHG
jgi:multiple sugar transport system substrate-binding protein